MITKKSDSKNKKACLITRHAIVNYGSFLQCFATQELLEQMKIDVTVLDYVRKDENYKNVTELLLSKSKKWNTNFFTRLVYRSVQWPDHYISGLIFERLRKKWLNLSVHYEKMDNNLTDVPIADYYCTGSDQVWGEIGSDQLDPAYFLDFSRSDNSKCIAIAASFGRSSYPPQRIELYKSLLEKYQNITVREKSALEIVELAGKSSELILDPTLIYGRESWMQHLPSVKNRKYVLLYQLNTNREMDTYAVEFAKRANLPLVRISVELHNIAKTGEFKWCLSPFKFLAYIEQAEYMITDSFHGTAFAIMFNTQFVEVLPEEKRTRNKNILELFGLEDRILTGYDDFSYVSEMIDYDYVNNKLDNAVKDSRLVFSKLLNER